MGCALLHCALFDGGCVAECVVHCWCLQRVTLYGCWVWVGLLSCHSNWMKELKNWCPSLRPFRFHGDKEERQAAVRGPIRDMQLEETRQFDVVVTTFEV